VSEDHTSADDKPVETELPADEQRETAVEALKTRLQDKLISFPDDPPRFVPTETEYEHDGKNRVRYWMQPSEFGAYVHYRDYRQKVHQLLHPIGLAAHAWDGHDGEGDDLETWRVNIEHDLFDPDGDFVVVLAVDYSEEVGAKSVLALATPTPEQAREMADALRVYADMAERQNRQRQDENES